MEFSAASAIAIGIGTAQWRIVNKVVENDRAEESPDHIIDVLLRNFSGKGWPQHRDRVRGICRVNNHPPAICDARDVISEARHVNIRAGLDRLYPIVNAQEVRFDESREAPVLPQDLCNQELAFGGEVTIVPR